MKFNKFLILALAGFTFFTSCSNDDLPDVPDEETGAYANGIFILNEGVFNSGNSTVSFIDENHTDVVHNVFSVENSGALLGDTGQSMGFYEDYAFIVVNVSNKIEIVDRNTFESIATLDEGLVNPRYITFSGGNAYVTNWGDGGNPDDDYVAVIDAETFTIEDNISVVEGPERIISEEGMVYVAHKGGWSSNNKVTVINAGSNTVVETITVGDNPVDLEIEGENLWVASSGYPWAPDETAGRISVIDTENYEVVREYEFPNVSDHPQNLEIENGKVYYTLGSAVYAMDVTETELPETAFMELEEVTSLYGFDIHDGRIYAASASADNNADGDLYVYDLKTRGLMTSFETGINPNGVYFND